MWECSSCGAVVDGNLTECWICGKKRGTEDRNNAELENKKGLSLPLIIFNVLYGSILYPVWVISTILRNGFFGGTPPTSEKVLGILLWIVYLGIWALVNRIIIKRKHQGDLLYLVVAIALLVIPTLIITA